MTELMTEAFLPINVVPTILLVLIVLYWIAVIAGLLDIEALDINLPDAGVDIDVDVDAGIDVDVDGDIDIDTTGALRSILHILYIGEVPIMILVSILILSMWTLCMIGNHYFNLVQSFLIAAPIYAVNIVVSLIICRIFAMPLKKLYDIFNKDSNAPKKVIGRICIVITTNVSDKMGQAEVKTKGAPILLNVVSGTDHVFRKGDEAVVTGIIQEKGVYTIAPIDLER